MAVLYPRGDALVAEKIRQVSLFYSNPWFITLMSDHRLVRVSYDAQILGAARLPSDLAGSE